MENTQLVNHDTAKLGVASHRLSLDLPLQDCETFSGFAIAVIRDPIDWLASHFHYTRKPGVISFSKADQFCSIEDYIQHLYAQRHDPHFRPPSQAKTLLRGTHTVEQDICMLLRQRRLFLLPQEHLLEGVTALSLRFPELLRDPSMEQSNVNLRSREPLPPEARNMIREVLVDDFRLHSLAHENFKDLLAELDLSFYQRKLRGVRRKSRFRSLFFSQIQTVSHRASQLVQSL
jgi:hypothetical protein